MKPFYEHGGITIYCGNCLEIMPGLEPPFAAIIADWPYGTTACSWDSVIPLGPLWKECKRLSDTVVVFGSQPFTTDLINSNRGWFKYCWVWNKNNSAGFATAKHRPFIITEDVCVFATGTMTYNPQMETRGVPRAKGGYSKSECYGLKPSKSKSNVYYPKNILHFGNASQFDKYHPTQKPEPLMAYLIRTYTTPGDIILDNTMGSGTTLVAAQNEGRRAVGIELDEGYCKIAVERLRQPSFFSIPEPAPAAQPRQVELTELIKRGLEK